MSPRAIMKLTPEGVADLHARAVSGDSEAARDFVKYSVWHEIQQRDYIPPNLRARVFFGVVRHINIQVNVNGASKS